MGSSAASGNGNLPPQFARVDFDRLNNRRRDEHQQHESLGKQDQKNLSEFIAKVEKLPHQSDVNMESYQDIKKIEENTSSLLNRSYKGIGNSTQKAFLSNSNKINLPNRSL